MREVQMETNHIDDSELEGSQGVATASLLSLPNKSEATTDSTDAQEFLWLFEYGFEMDLPLLNSPEQLDGLALLYGSAVLKGYRIVFDVVRSQNGEGQQAQQTQKIVTIVPSRELGAEVWGVLYRIPRRVIERLDGEPSLLDKVHSAAPPGGLFEPVNVRVHEAYRGRDISCITYIASKVTQQQQLHPLAQERRTPDPSYIQRLLESARQQKLPDRYLQELIARSTPSEQNTEPLSMAIDKESARAPIEIDAVRGGSQNAHIHRWMMAFALYLVLLFLAVLGVAVIQGLGVGSSLFTSHLTPLGIPWFVLVYGLLGGCVSSLVTFGRYRRIELPGFVLLTWFARPYIGAVLAGTAYLLLSCGFFVLSGSAEQRAALFSLVAVGAGLCEGWIFYRWV